MELVKCPECGETKNLKGRREGNVIRVACKGCGNDFLRDPDRCSRCGGPMHSYRAPLLQKARGTQQSILAYRIEKRCTDCDGPPPPIDGSATLDKR
jgi:Zn ribbon nucleic-acid-binding protein